MEKKILQQAIQKELHRSNYNLPCPDLPNLNRSKTLKEWYTKHNIKPPKKRAIASRVLEIWSKNQLKNRNAQLVQDDHRATLRNIDKQLLEIFSKRER